MHPVIRGPARQYLRSQTVTTRRGRGCNVMHDSELSTHRGIGITSESTETQSVQGRERVAGEGGEGRGQKGWESTVKSSGPGGGGGGGGGGSPGAGCGLTVCSLGRVKMFKGRSRSVEGRMRTHSYNNPCSQPSLTVLLQTYSLTAQLWLCVGLLLCLCGFIVVSRDIVSLAPHCFLLLSSASPTALCAGSWVLHGDSNTDQASPRTTRAARRYKMESGAVASTFHSFGLHEREQCNGGQQCLTGS